MPTIGGVDGRLDGIERERRFAAADEEHELADARAGGVGGDERAAGRLALFGPSGCSTSSFSAVQRGILARRHDIADDARDLHGLAPCTSIVIDDADDGGVHGTVLHARRPCAPSCR